MNGRSAPKGAPESTAKTTTGTVAPTADLCGCPRQADWWLCRGRPELECADSGELCELGAMLDATGSDYWPGAYRADGPNRCAMCNRRYHNPTRPICWACDPREAALAGVMS